MSDEFVPVSYTCVNAPELKFTMGGKRHKFTGGLFVCSTEQELKQFEAALKAMAPSAKSGIMRIEVDEALKIAKAHMARMQQGRAVRGPLTSAENPATKASRESLKQQIMRETGMSAEAAAAQVGLTNPAAPNVNVARDHILQTETVDPTVVTPVPDEKPADDTTTIAPPNERQMAAVERLKAFAKRD